MFSNSDYELALRQLATSTADLRRAGDKRSISDLEYALAKVRVAASVLISYLHDADSDEGDTKGEGDDQRKQAAS